MRELNMKKKYVAISTIMVLFTVVGILVYKSLDALDQIIQRAVEKYGSEMTQADVRLTDVSLDFKQGQAILNGLYIGNPEGYQTEYAMKLDQLKVTLDLESITSDTILIKEVLIQDPDLIYEKIEGISNFDALVNNINEYTGGGQEEKQSSDGEPKLIIEDLYINDGKVGVSYKIMNGKTMTVGLPNIHLEDIGKDDDGASPGEVASQVMEKITSGIGTALGSIKEGAGKVLGKGKEELEDVGDKLKGLFK